MVKVDEVFFSFLKCIYVCLIDCRVREERKGEREGEKKDDARGCKKMNFAREIFLWLFVDKEIGWRKKRSSPHSLIHAGMPSGERGGGGNF
jgi:hypothetical protein